MRIESSVAVVDPHRGAGRQDGHDRRHQLVRTPFRRHTPWGDEDSPALVTVAETALQRHLSVRIMKAGAEPKVKTLGAGRTLVEQGDPGHSLFLLLDGVLEVEVDGENLAEIGLDADAQAGVSMGHRREEQRR